MAADRDTLLTLLLWVEAKKTETAMSACQYPKADPFEHGKQVGSFAGLEVAEQRIRELLKSEEE